ncbi:hypothetical protein EVG20_g8473 [Dentipellis fragilis]|uniref:Uncharacterized protein n=1 Tax=Dentipellis fragilis TaxID=205917 RepID=A0A4Y9Y9W3_9AGAM|nr:hypothetical protein EVG20_g8473 [Dentipellis fragilis]
MSKYDAKDTSQWTLIEQGMVVESRARQLAGDVFLGALCGVVWSVRVAEFGRPRRVLIGQRVSTHLNASARDARRRQRFGGTAADAPIRPRKHARQRDQLQGSMRTMALMKSTFRRSMPPESVESTSSTVGLATNYCDHTVIDLRT